VAAQSDAADAEALQKFTGSIKIEQHKDRAVLTATIPPELFRGVSSEKPR